jgi:hypothetical protein
LSVVAIFVTSGKTELAVFQRDPQHLQRFTAQPPK